MALPAVSVSSGRAISFSAKTEKGEGCVGLSGIAATGSSNVGLAGAMKETNNGGAYCGENLGCRANADLGAVLVKGDIAAIVAAVLDGSMPANQVDEGRRARPAATWDAADAALLLFGGSGLHGARADTYAYRPGGGWSVPRPHPGVPPAPRSSASAVYDPVRHGLLHFGGGDTMVHDDLWEPR